MTPIEKNRRLIIRTAGAKGIHYPQGIPPNIREFVKDMKRDGLMTILKGSECGGGEKIVPTQDGLLLLHAN